MRPWATRSDSRDCPSMTFFPWLPPRLRITWASNPLGVCRESGSKKIFPYRCMSFPSKQGEIEQTSYQKPALVHRGLAVSFNRVELHGPPNPFRSGRNHSARTAPDNHGLLSYHLRFPGELCGDVCG